MLTCYQWYGSMHSHFPKLHKTLYIFFINTEVQPFLCYRDWLLWLFWFMRSVDSALSWTSYQLLNSSLLMLSTDLGSELFFPLRAGSTGALTKPPKEIFTTAPPTHTHPGLTPHPSHICFLSPQGPQEFSTIWIKSISSHFQPHLC